MYLNDEIHEKRSICWLEQRLNVHEICRIILVLVPVWPGSGAGGPNTLGSFYVFEAGAREVGCIFMWESWRYLWAASPAPSFY